MDLYVILGLPHGATESDIKRAYRRLARRFHPDINPGDRMAETRFRQILEADQTLIDPDRRSRYDSGGSDDATSSRGSGFEGFDFSVRGADHSATFGDLFAEVLSDRGTRRTPEQALISTFQCSSRSRKRLLEARARSRSLAVRPAAPARAPAARAPVRENLPGVPGIGRGSFGERPHGVLTHLPCLWRVGAQRPRPCEVCGGIGQETRSETVNVRIPAGVRDGDRIRVAAKGNAGIRGGPPGDLYITAAVDSHPVFSRDGNDVHMVLPIAVHEAALGARLEVVTPDGLARLRVPPGTQSGQRFRLRERGAPSTRDGSRGDLVVEVRLMLPKVLDERSKELLKEFGRINGENVRDSQG